VRKQGVALADVDGFPRAAVERLRDDASITTAEEFADLARRMAPSLQSLLEIDDASFARLRALAEHAAGSVAQTPGDFRTGMDPPH
jgi:hypothetical protein